MLESVCTDKVDRRIVELVLAGAPNKAIARDVGLPVGTVKWRLHRMYARLGVATRTQFVLVLHERGPRRDDG